MNRRSLCFASLIGLAGVFSAAESSAQVLYPYAAGYAPAVVPLAPALTSPYVAARPVIAPVAPAAYTTPYAAAYAPAYTPTYSAGYAPTYSAGYAPTYSAAYAPAAYAAPLVAPAAVAVPAVVRSKVYVPGQPLLNIVRAVTP